MENFPVNSTIQEFASFFKNRGFVLYIVGGAVRDYLLGVDNSDFDFCTDAKPEEVMSIFKNVIPTGIKHGTVTVMFKGNSFEVTTFRTESTYSDCRHPDSVNYVRKLEEDLSRRDFTVNAFAADCTNGKIIDIFNGIKDLKNKKLKAIGKPEMRFEEDALRLLRFCRFCSKLSFKPDRKTLKAATLLSDKISFVSEERIFEETSKMLMSANPIVGLELAHKIGILKHIIPELDRCSNIEQNKVGSDNVLNHIFNSVQAAADRNANLTVRWALLLHDIGKPDCMKKVGSFTRFFGHDTASAVKALEVAKRLKFSNKLTEDINVLIANHMVKYNSNWSDGAVKRFINRIGYDRIIQLFEVQWCDQIASEGSSKEKEYEEFIKRIETCKNEALSIKDLSIDGKVLSELGIPKSKIMGEILDELLEMVIDYPNLNDKETLSRQALLIFKTKSSPS